MEALDLEDDPEAKDRITVVGNKELKNKKGKVSVANVDVCIGCGVCAYKCPTKSLILKRRPTVERKSLIPIKKYQKLAVESFKF